MFLSDGVVRWPYGAAETASVDDRDVAAVAARTLTEGSWPRPVVDMLLDAWGATMERPAFITSTVADILGSGATKPERR